MTQLPLAEAMLALCYQGLFFYILLLSTGLPNTNRKLFFFFKLLFPVLHKEADVSDRLQNSFEIYAPQTACRTAGIADLGLSSSLHCSTSCPNSMTFVIFAGHLQSLQAYLLHWHPPYQE